jgi:hypothetical protein
VDAGIFPDMGLELSNGARVLPLPIQNSFSDVLLREDADIFPHAGIVVFTMKLFGVSKYFFAAQYGYLLQWSSLP